MKNINHIVISGLVSIGFFFAVPFSSYSETEAPTKSTSEATPPTELIKTTIEDVSEYVSANKGKVSDAQMHAKLQELIFPAFDFKEMARRSLGKNWKAATEAERKEFVDLFSELIATNYESQVVKHVAETKFDYTDEKIQGKRAFVRANMLVDDDEVSVAYRLKMKKNGWKVYDMVIANISLVSNYRSEFSGIVRKEKMSGLIARLKEKLTQEQDKKQKDSA